MRVRITILFLVLAYKKASSARWGRAWWRAAWG